jgi:hypothetical protein
MPVIDVYAVAGTFSDKHRLAQDLAKAVMKWEASRRSIYRNHGGGGSRKLIRFWNEFGPSEVEGNPLQAPPSLHGSSA